MSEKRLQEAIEYNDKKTDEMIDEIVFTRWIDPTIEEKDEEIERLHSIIKEAIEYIEEKEGILLNCDEGWLDHDEMIDKKRFEKILEILDKDSDKE